MRELRDSLELFAPILEALLYKFQSGLHFLQHHCEGEGLSEYFFTVLDAL